MINPLLPYYDKRGLPVDDALIAGVTAAAAALSFLL